MQYKEGEKGGGENIHDKGTWEALNRERTGKKKKKGKNKNSE